MERESKVTEEGNVCMRRRGEEEEHADVMKEAGRGKGEVKMGGQRGEMVSCKGCGKKNGGRVWKEGRES